MIDYADHAYVMFDAGVCPVPVRTDGSKRPAVKTWTQWQNERYDRDEIETLFAGAGGIGTICGAASGNLEMLEFEGKAIAEGTYVEFLNRVKAAGWMGVFRRIAEGYAVMSPTGGMHVQFRVDGLPLGNTKLARRPATPEELAENPDERVKVLIETRGQGGFVVSPPSNGSCHPSGGAWTQITGGVAGIATITEEERDALYDIARSLDEIGMPGPSAQGPGVPLSQITGPARDDQSPLDWARENIDPVRLMEEGGWTFVSQRGSEQRWTRPGKDTRKGHSAVLHLPEGPLNIFSSSVDPAYERAGRRTGAEITLSVPELYAAVHFGGDLSDASSHLRQRVMPRGGGGGGRTTTDPSAAPAPEGSVSLNLPPEFWEARDWLTQVRQAAWSEKVSPDAVWEVLLSRVAAAVDPSIVLPGMGTLDLFVVIAGHSGAGKSKAGKVARMLYPITNTKVLHDMPIGSGEGLVEAFFRWVDEEGNICSPSKKGAEKVLWFTGAHFMTDEGVALTATAGRSGSIIVPILCQAWMGETMGQTLADATRSRIIPAGRVRVAAQLNIQTANGWKLFADEYAATGLSQRMLCAHAIDPTISGDAFTTPEFPGPIDITLPYIVPGQTRTVTFPPEVEAEIDLALRMAHHPEWTGDPLDTHSLLLQRKIAAIMAIIEGRMATTLDDWSLAAQALATHKAVRSLLQMTKVRADREARVTQDTHFSERHALAAEIVHRAQLDRAIKAIEARLVPGEAIRKRMFSAPQREVFEEAMQQLVDRGLVEQYETHNRVIGWKAT